MLLHLPGPIFLLTERFDQDSLESYCGEQRSRGCYSDNPTVQQYLDNCNVEKSRKLGSTQKECQEQKTTTLNNRHKCPTTKNKKKKILMIVTVYIMYVNTKIFTY